MTPLRLAAPAKLNLSLAVTGRRTDGYHELAGVVVLLELADQLLLLPGCAGLRVETHDPHVPLDATNLAWLGLTAGLRGEPELACLSLEKRIPAAAGLGGGSSDAAAAWRLGRRSSGAEGWPEESELAALAAIGADVPFFAAATAAAYVSGIGERIEPLPAPDPPLEVILAHPTVGLSTAAVFAELRPSERSAEPPERHANRTGANDLLPAVLRLRPEVDELFALVAAAGGEPHLTGSGPTVFALTDDPERAAAISARLARAGVRATRTRTRRSAARIESVAEEEQA